MARNSDQLAGHFETGNTGGVMSGLLAEEDVFDRRALWRIGSWGVGAVGAVVLAVLANQSQLSLRREQVAAADLTRQSQQLQSFAKETTNETRRLASAVDTLNGDRDRLYSRVTVLEQGLDSVTGAIARQRAPVAPPQPQPQAVAAPSPAASPVAAEPKVAAQNPAPAPSPSPAAPPPVAAPVATTMAMLPAKPADKPQPAAAAEQAPAAVAAGAPKVADPPQPAPPPAPLVSAKSMMAPPDPAATKLVEPEQPAKAITAAPMADVVASAPPAEKAEEDTPAAAPEAPAADVAVQKTEFGVDIGGANSVPGLRALWRGLLKSRSNAALTRLRPIIVIREGNNGLGMQLRLVAGPLSDAAAAAKICAGLMENKRPCETAVFDGQRLAMRPDEHQIGEPGAAAAKPAPEARPALHRRFSAKRASNDDAAKKPDTVSTLSSFFGGGKH
jgi:hypothetical protein